VKASLVSPRFSYVREIASNRQRSEDAAEVFQREDVLVVALADGVGGVRDGAIASGVLVAAVRAAVDDPAFAVENVRHWADLFRVIDSALAENNVGETTGVVVVAAPSKLLGVSTGDSEAWIVESTRVENLTAGQETKRTLGSGRVTPATFERQALSGVLLVASDGLFKYAAMDVIAGMVRASPAPEVAKQLVELVRLRSGLLADDVALVLLSANPTSSRRSLA
jgi:PPM family protein phosphatase